MGKLDTALPKGAVNVETVPNLKTFYHTNESWQDCQNRLKRKKKSTP